LNREISLRGKFIVAMQLFSLRKALKADTYDIIHVHSLNRPIISFLDEFNIPIVVTDHGFWHQRHSSSLSKQVRFDKKIRTHVGIARRVISVSAYAQSRLRPFIGEESKSVLIPNPITFKKDYSLEAGKFKQKEKKYIFFNGFTESVKIKGLKDLLEALVVLKEDVKLIVIANEEGQKLCELYAGKVDLKVYSAQPFSKVQEFYAVSNVFVLPSKSESFGLVYLEALSFGVPVIGFEPTCSEFAKVLQCDIGDTYTSNKDTIEDLAAKIKSVLSREFDNEMIRQRVSDNYGWDKGVHKFISCYKSVLENEANN
jgi:glycosyltransferase involved in cell wall biosynthesis